MRGSLRKTGEENKKKGVSFDSHTKVEEKGDNDFKPPKIPRLTGPVSSLPGSVAIGPGIVYHNPDLICSSNDVGRVTFAELLAKASQLRVPLFQRRYCWDKRTWHALLRDTLNAKIHGHSLGRALVYHSLNSLSDTPDGKANDVMTTLTIIDGQQRTTTLMVLLAAIRDVMLSRIAAIDEAEDKKKDLSPSSSPSAPLSSLQGEEPPHAPTNVTFHFDAPPLSSDSSSSSPASSSPASPSPSSPSSPSPSSPPSSSSSLPEKDKNKLSVAVVEIQRLLFIQQDDGSFEHCRLVPTHFDRPAFLRTMAISRGEASPGTDEGNDDEPPPKEEGEEEKSAESDKKEEEALENRLCEAKDFFMGQLRKFGTGSLLKLPPAILNRLTFLYFNMREQDLMTVYERMAIKEGMFKGLLYVATPGVQMTSADLTRNLLLSYFVDDAARIEAYEKYWMQIEVRASEKGITNQEHLEAILADYLLVLRGNLIPATVAPPTTATTDTSMGPPKRRVKKVPIYNQTTNSATAVDAAGSLPTSTSASPADTATATATATTAATTTAATTTTTTTTLAPSTLTDSTSAPTSTATTPTLTTPDTSLFAPTDIALSETVTTPAIADSPRAATDINSTATANSPVSALGPAGDSLLSETSSAQEPEFNFCANVTAATTTPHTSSSTVTSSEPSSSSVLASTIVPHSVALLVGEERALVAIAKAFERPQDVLHMTGADRVGGIYALVRRYLLSLVPDSSLSASSQAAAIASVVMSDLAAFSKTWTAAQSLSLNQKGLLHGKLELVDLIRAMQENEGR